jgi:CheY-like chemotaxis protein
LPLLFEPFIQADSSTTRKYGGTGLGLSICKGIIEKMGGQISVGSRVNHGSVFTFQIQLQQASSKPDFQTIRPANLTALLLSAHESSYSILASQLADLGVKPKVVSTSHEFLQEMKNGRYSLVFINADLNMEQHHHAEASELPSSKRVRLYGVDSGSNTLNYDLIIRRPVSLSELARGISKLYSPLEKPSHSVAKYKSVETLALQGKSFLLAEDNTINQLVAVEMLKKFGIKLDVAANGKEALKLIDAGEYDFVFMDVQMPEIDGLEATLLIRQNEKIRQPYIIAMTANAMEEDRQTCLRAGMNDFLSKPLNLANLHQVLEAAAASEFLKPSTNLH